MPHVPAVSTPWVAGATALFGVAPLTETALSLRDTAVAAGVLVVDLELLATGIGPWTGVGAPGQAGGCALTSGAAGNLITLRTDRGGLFLAATLDLILRANGIRAIVLTGEMPSELVATLRQFSARNEYELATTDAFSVTGCGDAMLPATGKVRRHDAGALEASWRAAGGNRCGWWPESKAAELLTTLARRIDPAHTALVLIDVQNDFCDPHGASARGSGPVTMIRAAVARILQLLSAARAAGVMVIHVGAEYGALYRGVGSPYRFPSTDAMDQAVWTASAADLSGSSGFAPQEVEVCLPGSWGQRFVDGIDPAPAEPVVIKHRFSAFVDTGLEQMLRARGVRTVVLVGVTTNCCVESTAREVAMRDFYLVVPEDCVAVKDRLRSLHDASLESMRLYFGQVGPAQALMDIWSRAAPTPRSAEADG